MIVIKDKSMCNSCAACTNVCPKHCITMKRDEEGYLYPKVNNINCVNCGLCENVCPVLNNKIDNKGEPIAYAAYNIDENTRLNSSSGGIFSLIASYILNESGVVYGATFIEGKVKHIRVDNIKDLPHLYKSKYIQSEIGNMYQLAKEDLDNKKKVLFTGTPCQVEGLLSFLNKDYDNLYTQDIICHGVPSLKAWREYMKYLNINNTLVNVDFRKKTNGWVRFSLAINSEINEHENDHHEDLFMKSFLSNINLRPSCYNCKFKKIHRESDITLGDFWGVDNVCPEMNDNKGTSLILIHSSKGKQLFENIKSNIKYKQVDFIKSIISNPSYTQVYKTPKNRKQFFKNLDKVPFDVNVNRCTNLTIIDKIKRKIKRILNKILKKY